MNEWTPGECSLPPPLSETDLLDAWEGEAGRELQDHLAGCAFCAERVARLKNTEAALRHRFYRLDCPSSETLSDYQSGWLAGDALRRVEQHLGSCPLCRAEVADYAALGQDASGQFDEEALIPPSRQGKRDPKAFYLPFTLDYQRPAEKQMVRGAASHAPLSVQLTAPDFHLLLVFRAISGTRQVSGTLEPKQDDDAFYQHWKRGLVELYQHGQRVSTKVLGVSLQFEFTLKDDSPIEIRLTALDSTHLVLSDIAQEAP